MIRLKLGVLEDVIDPAVVRELELGRAHAPEPLLAFWRAALARLEVSPVFAAPQLNADLVRAGLAAPGAEIEVLLCARHSLDALTGCPGALGVHLITTPDCDPFHEESNASRAHRVLVVSDQDEFLRLIGDLAEDDIHPSLHEDEYLRAYLATMFHEIAHAVLFAENTALMTPADFETLSDAGEVDHDLFDASTGYGIRPLLLEGTATWADTIEEAHEMMETYVEAEAHRYMRHALIGDEAPHRFAAAMGVAAELETLLGA